MYIRRKVFSRAIDHETGEEKLFSVNEVISEESYQRMFAEAEEEEKPKKGTLRKVGKGVALTGSAIGLSTAPSYFKTLGDRSKAIKKIAEKTGTVNVGGDGFFKPAQYLGNNPAKATALDRRHAKLMNKKLEKLGRIDKTGTGLALAGTALYGYGRYKDSKKKKEENK